jgi:diguanylate cyclase (GGDEF)-like protein
MMDVDNFRRINEKLGHRYGDDLIKKIASTLQTLTETTDVIGRYGGEEFIMIINNGDLEKTVDVAEKIKAQIGQIPIKDKLGLTMNIGIAFYTNESAIDLIACANEKLIQAKSLGKHRKEKK